MAALSPVAFALPHISVAAITMPFHHASPAKLAARLMHS
jgi:hypothetical protein